MNEYGRCFISDVGLAKDFCIPLLGKGKATTPSPEENRNWMAPEMLASLSSDNKIPKNLCKLDVFSLGLITLYAIDRDGYMKQNEKLNIDKNLLEGFLQRVEEKGLIPDDEFLSVLRSMVCFDIESRISIENLYNWMVILFQSIIRYYNKESEINQISFRFKENSRKIKILSRNYSIFLLRKTQSSKKRTNY
jgi:serine/threonine protein kinase